MSRLDDPIGLGGNSGSEPRLSPFRYSKRISQLTFLALWTITLGISLNSLFKWAVPFALNSGSVVGPSSGIDLLWLAFLVLGVIGITAFILIFRKRVRLLLMLDIGLLAILFSGLYAYLGCSIILKVLPWVSGMGLFQGYLLAFLFICALIAMAGMYFIRARSNSFAIFLGAMAIAFIPLSISSLTLIVGLGLLSVYDLIAVYKTKSMLSMANASIFAQKEGKEVFSPLPLLFFAGDTANLQPTALDVAQERQMSFLGLGDVIVPGALIVSYSGDFVLACSLILAWTAGLYLDFWIASRTKKAIPALPLIFIAMMAVLAVSWLL